MQIRQADFRGTVLGIFDFFRRSPADQGGRSPVPLETQLAELEAFGIRPREGLGVEDLLKLDARESYETRPYDTLLFVLGGTIAEAPWTRVSSDILHLDVECIEGPGSYVRIASELAEIARGALPLTDVADSFDDETATLAFSLDGEPYSIVAKIEDDWLDERVLERLAALAVPRGAGSAFYLADLGDSQDTLLVWLSPSQAKSLGRLSGYPFRRMGVRSN